MSFPLRGKIGERERREGGRHWKGPNGGLQGLHTGEWGLAKWVWWDREGIEVNVRATPPMSVTRVLGGGSNLSIGASVRE